MTELARPDRAAVGSLLVEREDSDDAVLLTVYGEVDIQSSAQLESMLEAAQAIGPAQVVIDLDGLSFMDSTGLQLLVRAARRAAANGRRLELRRVPAKAMRLFELTGTLGLFNLTT